MAFTGKKIKGSEVLTEETIENRKKFYNLMNDIEENNPEEYEKLKDQMFWSMFEHLTHKHEREFIEWARRVEHATFFNKVI